MAFKGPDEVRFGGGMLPTDCTIGPAGAAHRAKERGVCEASAGRDRKVDGEDPAPFGEPADSDRDEVNPALDCRARVAAVNG